MQSENIITSYKTKLKENGFLDIDLNELYPNIFQEFRKTISEELLLSRLDRIHVDSMIDSKHDINFIKDIIKETIPGEYQLEQTMLRDTQGKPQQKLEFSPSFTKVGQVNLLTKLKNKIIKISNQLFQSWIEGRFIPKSSEHILIRTLVNTILEDFYDITSNPIGDLDNPFNITCFQENDLIVSHKDSDGANFKCVVLLYLSDGYQEGFGGELNLMGHYKVKPTFGKLVILDFENHNIEHEVIKVNEDYFRLAITTFISNDD